MMPPGLLLVGAGRRGGIWIPLPVIVLWPLWLFGWVVWGAARLLRRPWANALRAGLIVLARLSGLRLCVDRADGTRIRLRLI